MAKKLAFDRWLFSAIVSLVVVGLVMVYSASGAIHRGATANPLFVKQMLAAVLGLVAMAVLMHLDYRELRRPVVAYSLIGGVLLLLVAVLFSPVLNETRRWIFVAGVSVQPSELAKLGLIGFLAYQANRKQDRINTPEFLLPALTVTALVVGLVLAQPDYGTSVLLLGIAASMMFLAGLAWRYVLAAGAIAVPALAFFALSADYRMKRILAFLNPENDPQGSGFQAIQSLIAVGSGGLIGLGPGESVQKLFFLPYAHSDYIFAVLCEEFGLIGAALVVALFGVILWRGVKAGSRAPDPLGRYLAWGVTGFIVVQALAHISVSLAMLPSTGVPLPFISYGGSSMVVTLISCGVLLNVSQHG